MRIALLTYSTKPRGGVVHTLELAEALAESGHDVTIWTLGRGGDTTFFRPVNTAVKVQVVPFSPVPQESVGERILRSIETFRAAFIDDYDIVHAQDCISANSVPWCIRTIHHLDHFTTPQLAECHEKAIVNPVAHICVSTAVADEVTNGWGLTPEVIPNGVNASKYELAAADTALARHQRDEWKQQLGNFVLAVGGIEPRKGSLELLQSFDLVRRENPDVRLVFAGGETLFDYRDYRTEFETIARDLDIPYTVLGVVDDGLMPSLIASASVMSFVSKKEGFGLAAMEALAAGTPVVASDLPVLHEVLGESALFAAGPQKISKAILAALAGEAPDSTIGRALARSYRWDSVATKHERFYSSVLTRASAANRHGREG